MSHPYLASDVIIFLEVELVFVEALTFSSAKGMYLIYKVI